LQDDLLDDDDEDRLILDRSPDETASQEDLDELESDDDLEGTMASDGERVIYPWMKKIHVAGVGKLSINISLTPFCNLSARFLLLSILNIHPPFSALFQFKSGLLFA